MLTTVNSTKHVKMQSLSRHLIADCMTGQPLMTDACMHCRVGISLVCIASSCTGADNEHQAHLHSSPHCQGRGSTPPQTHHFLVWDKGPLVGPLSQPCALFLLTFALVCVAVGIALSGMTVLARCVFLSMIMPYHFLYAVA